MNLNVYEGIKAVRKVKSLEEESQGTNLGVLPFGVSILLSKNHVEFIVTIEAKKSNNEIVWLGYYFSSSFLKFQKIFKKSNGSSIDNLSYENISSILHKNLVTKFEDPYSCPFYITGNNDSRAYWTVLHQNQVIGHIPLHRSDSFHSLQSYPVLYLENDIQIVIGTDLDRNQLFPSYSNVDTLYNSTLRGIDTIFSQNKWSATVIPVIKQNDDGNNGTITTTATTTTNVDQSTVISPSSSSDSISPLASTASTITTTTTTTSLPSTTNTTPSKKSIGKSFDLYTKQLLSKNQFDLEKLSRWFIKKFNSSSPLTFAYGVSMYRKSNTKTMDLLTLKTLQTGKTYIVNLLHTFRLIPSLDYFKDSDIQKNFEISNLPQYTQKFLELEKDCQIIKTLFPTTSVSIYNPFFDKYVKKTFKIYSPLTLESSFIISHPNLSQGLSNQQQQQQQQQQQKDQQTQSQQQTPQHIVDPVSLSSSISSPSSSITNSNTSSSLPFVSISNTESSNNENILDKLKKLEKIINKNDRQQINSTSSEDINSNNSLSSSSNSISNINNSINISNNSNIDVDKLASIVAKLMKDRNYI